MTTISRPRPALAVLFLALLASSIALISVARAAEPSEGAVSKSSPKVEWTGPLVSSGIFANAWNNGLTDTPCESPTCDPFTLVVADGGPGVNLVIKSRLQSTAAQGNNGTMTLRVTDPSGTVTIYTGESGPEHDLKTTIKNAASGTYQIDSTASFVCCSPSSHISNAELTGAGFSTASAPPPTRTTEETPAPPAAPTSLKIKAPTVSAKKVKKARKVAARLTTSAALTDVNVLLEAPKKALASLKLARLEGSQKVTLKLSKKAAKLLKKGKTYQLSAGGTDAEGRNVVAAARLKVKK